MKIRSLRRRPWLVGFVLVAAVTCSGPRAVPAATDKDLLLTPPVPGIAFPRQKPTEGVRESMTAALVATLRLEDGCLQLQSPAGQVAHVPIWPPEFTLRLPDDRAAGDEVLVIDGAGEVVARTGEEVFMSGGESAVSDPWVLQQIPPACRGAYWIVGDTVRPNLRYGSDLFALDVLTSTGHTLFFLRQKPPLQAEVHERGTLQGTLAPPESDRCLHIWTEWGPGVVTPLWPPDWSARVEGDTVVLIDGAGQAVARTGETVRLTGGVIPLNWESEVIRRLFDELPGDCLGTYWIVAGVE